MCKTGQYVYVFVCLIVLVTFWLALNELRKSRTVVTTSIQFNIVDDNNARNTANSGKISEKTVNTNGKVKAKEKVHVPKFMLDLYEGNRNGFGKNRTRPDVVKSVLPKEGDSSLTGPTIEDLIENHMLAFEVPSSNEDEHFLSAELKILTLIQKSKSYVGVERTVTISVFNESKNEFFPLDQRHLYHFENTWISFDLTSPVDALIRNESREKKLLKIILSVRSVFSLTSTISKEFRLSLMPTNNDIEHDYPILLLSYTSNDHGRKRVKKEERRPLRRKKRNVEDDYEEETNKLWDTGQTGKAQSKRLRRLKNTCRRKPLYVDFAEIGYDSWIVQPSGYEAFQCAGKCFYPVAEHLSPTKHAIVQALLHSVSPNKVSRSCCTPTLLNSISLLYIDEKGILTYRYAYGEMVVEQCGCR